MPERQHCVCQEVLGLPPNMSGQKYHCKYWLHSIVKTQGHPSCTKEGDRQHEMLYLHPRSCAQLKAHRCNRHECERPDCTGLHFADKRPRNADLALEIFKRQEEMVARATARVRGVQASSTEV